MGEETLREGGRAAIYRVDADVASWQRAAWTSANQEFNEVQNLGEDGLIRTCSARRNPALAEKLYQATRKNNLAASKRAC